MRLLWLIVFLAFFAVPSFAEETTTSDSVMGSLQAKAERAEQGDAGAQFELGLLYYQGNGVTRDYSEAARWLRKADEQGDTLNSAALLGTMYYEGRGVPQDYEEVYFWLSLAAVSGGAEATSARNRAAQKLSPEALAD